MNISLKELDSLRERIIVRYKLEKQDRKIEANDIRYVTTPSHYEALEEIFKLVLRDYKPKPGSEYVIISCPSAKFFARLFSTRKEINCYPALIDACYLFAFNQTRNERYGKNSFLMEGSYSVRVSRRSDIDAVFKLNTLVYEGYDVIPYETLMDWHSKNPASIHVITNHFGKIIGNIDILPLKKSALDALLSGELIEMEIRGEDLYAPQERASVNYLYVESVVNNAGVAADIELLRNFCIILNRLCQTHKSIKEVYCLAASPEGKHYMTHLGFTPYNYVGPAINPTGFYRKRSSSILNILVLEIFPYSFCIVG
jgi:hypothetical protein